MPTDDASVRRAPLPAARVDARQAPRITLHDVARAAGTSRSTVSRALSGTGYVAADLRDRVVEAAERLGYVPDASARTLKQRSSRLVGLLVSDLGNTFYSQLTAGVEQGLRGTGYQVVLVDDHGDEQQELEGVRAFLAMRVAGVVLTPNSPRSTELLLRHQVCVVEADRRSGARGCDVVTVDGARGAREVTEHLLALGHRGIVLLVDETHWSSGAGRRHGYELALEESGIPVDQELVVDVGLASEDVGGRLGDLLARRHDVTAVLAINNVLAEHAWRALHQRGVRVPADVSVASYDDLAWMSMVEPPVTAVRQPVLEMGSRAAQLLLGQLTGEHGGGSVVDVLSPRLVVRRSTAAPRAGSSALAR